MVSSRRTRLLTGCCHQAGQTLALLHSGDDATTTVEIAKSLVALCAEGKFDEAGERYWADDVVSREVMDGSMTRIQGKDAALGKGEWCAGAREVQKSEVGGPYVNGGQFIVRFTMDLTVRESGQRVTMDQVGLYTVRHGKIVEASFFQS